MKKNLKSNLEKINNLTLGELKTLQNNVKTSHNQLENKQKNMYAKCNQKSSISVVPAITSLALTALCGLTYLFSPQTLLLIGVMTMGMASVAFGTLFLEKKYRISSNIARKLCEHYLENNINEHETALKIIKETIQNNFDKENTSIQEKLAKLQEKNEDEVCNNHCSCKVSDKKHICSGNCMKHEEKTKEENLTLEDLFQ